MFLYCYHTDTAFGSLSNSLDHSCSTGDNSLSLGIAWNRSRQTRACSPTILQVGGEAEKMGKSLLSSQFIAGLSDQLKTKMVGCAGVFEEPLAQARFEVARRILALARM